ncbi:MAG: hypothetical protein R3D55_24290 [Chloroflexota bacterium]
MKNLSRLRHGVSPRRCLQKPIVPGGAVGGTASPEAEAVRLVVEARWAARVGW